MSSEENRESPSWILDALESHEGPLVSYAARILGDVDRARDVVQETFLRLCRQDRGEVEEHLAQWLFTVCRNRALDVRAKEKPMTTAEVKTFERRSPDPGPDAVLERKDAISRVFTCVESLPEKQREVLRLKFQHGLSYREISGVMKLTTSNVGFLIHQGLKALKERLAEATAPTAAPNPAVQDSVRESMEGKAS